MLQNTTKYDTINIDRRNTMEVALLVMSVLLIIIVLLQSGKAESAGQIIQGGNSDLFANRKERGLELFISRFTMLLGVAYFALSLFIYLK